MWKEWSISTISILSERVERMTDIENIEICVRACTDCREVAWKGDGLDCINVQGLRYFKFKYLLLWQW
jgi:hypothetical protein